MTIFQWSMLGSDPRSESCPKIDCFRSRQVGAWPYSLAPGNREWPIANKTSVLYLFI